MYRSLRGAVPAAAPTSSQRPSSDTRSEWYSSLPPLLEDQLVAVGVGPEPVAPDPPVERGLALGDRAGSRRP